MSKKGNLMLLSSCYFSLESLKLPCSSLWAIQHFLASIPGLGLWDFTADPAELLDLDKVSLPSLFHSIFTQISLF